MALCEMSWPDAIRVQSLSEVIKYKSMKGVFSDEYAKQSIGLLDQYYLITTTTQSIRISG